MCGIVGLISKNQYGFLREQQEIFASLLFVDLLRGADSTGMFVVNRDGDVYVAKDASHSLDFMQTEEYEEGQKRAFRDGMVMIGHNRKATKGTVVDRNAHPFNVENNIILVHNGTMSEDHTKHADVEVDSHAIAHLIHEKKNLSEALSSFWGAYALVWYDVENSTVNMIRNSQRPLWWMETGNAWIWASTPDMLEFVKHRHNLKVINEPTQLPEEVHQQYKLRPDHTWEVSNEKIELKRKTYYSTGYNGEWAFPSHGAGGRRDRFLNDTTPDYDAAFEEYIEKQYGSSERGQRRQQPSHGAVQLLPSPKSSNDTKSVIDLEPPEFAGLITRERDLARESNNIIPYGEWMDRIIKNGYKWGDKVHVVPFDYTYVNGRDTSDGFYLYSIPIDGDSVIFRQYMSSRIVTEERILQLASGGYLYESTVTRKGWTPLQGADAANNYRNDTPGYVIVTVGSSALLKKPSEHGTQTIH